MSDTKPMGPFLNKLIEETYAKKPEVREWTLDGEMAPPHAIKGPNLNYQEAVDVIEKSAYDAVVKERDELINIEQRSFREYWNSPKSRFWDIKSESDQHLLTYFTGAVMGKDLAKERIAQLERSLDVAKAALEFYADSGNYEAICSFGTDDIETQGYVIDDGGERARQALAEIGGKEIG